MYILDYQEEYDRRTTMTHNGFEELAIVATIAGWHIRDTNSPVVVVKEDSGSTSIAAQVEIALYVHDAVHVGWMWSRQRNEIVSRCILPVAASLRRPV